MLLPISLLALAIFIAPLKAALPEEALWSPVVAALILFVAGWECARALRGGSPPMPSGIGILVGVFIAWASLAVIWQWLGVNHGRPEYLDAMIRTLAYWFAGSVLVIYLQPLLRRRSALYACLGALVASAAVAAYLGLQDYLIHVAAHEASWREFGTSTPDYFAGFLVMTIPVTLALFIGVPTRPGIAAPLIYGLALVPQIAVLPTTGSRFGLVSLAASCLVIVLAYWLAYRSGSRLRPSQSIRIGIALLLFVGAAVLVAKPVSLRLTRSVAAEQQHSGAFRVWTWRGALRMAEHNPIFGTGPGTFIYRYQKYALVGYTRVAHNSYLQTADEIGIPGALLLTAGLLLIGLTGVKALSVRDAAPEASYGVIKQKHSAKSGESFGRSFLSRFALQDEKLLLCGLLGALAAGLIQNLIDSDWYFVFNGITLWLVAGLILCVSHEDDAACDSIDGHKMLRNMFAWKGAVWCTIMGLVMIAWAGAESRATLAAAQAASSDPGAAADAYAEYDTAIGINPLRSDYHSRRALTVDPVTDPGRVEPDLRRAADLEPSGVSFRRLATFYLNSGRPLDALKAAQSGLSIEPSFTKLWNLAAQANLAMGNVDGARSDYLRAAAIEISKIGTIRAVTEVVDIDYADADLFLGDDAMSHANFGLAVMYYRRVEEKLREYALEGGTTNQMRMAQIGDHSDSALDERMRDDYSHAASELLKALEVLKSPDAAAIVQRQSSITLEQFDSVIKLSAGASSAH